MCYIIPQRVKSGCQSFSASLDKLISQMRSLSSSCLNCAGIDELLLNTLPPLSIAELSTFYETHHTPWTLEVNHLIQVQGLPRSEAQVDEQILNLGNSKSFSCDN